MLKLGDSSSSLVIFWSQNNNGRFARCAFPQLLGDLSTRSPSPFRRFSIADPGDFASLLKRVGTSFVGILARPGITVLAAFFCFYEVLLWNVDVSLMNFDHSAAFLIFNAHFEQTQEDN